MLFYTNIYIIETNPSTTKPMNDTKEAVTRRQKDGAPSAPLPELPGACAYRGVRPGLTHGAEAQGATPNNYHQKQQKTHLGGSLPGRPAENIPPAKRRRQ